MDHNHETIIRKFLVEADELGYSFINHEGQDDLGEYDRQVDIAPSWIRDHTRIEPTNAVEGRYDLQFRDRHFDLSQTIGGGDLYELKAVDAVRAIDVFLTGYLLEDDGDGFDQFINQADRVCYIVEGSITPTRLRICYDLPASGPTEATRHHVSFQKYRSQEEIANRTRRRARLPGEHLQNVRYIARLY